MTNDFDYPDELLRLKPDVSMALEEVHCVYLKAMEGRIPLEEAVALVEEIGVQLQRKLDEFLVAVRDYYTFHTDALIAAADFPTYH